MKKKTKKKIFYGILILAGLILIAKFSGLFTISEFDLGYLPYGESNNQIIEGKYWIITKSDYYSYFEGNDFDLRSVFNGGFIPGMGQQTYSGTVNYITKDDFSEKTFRARLSGQVTCENGVKGTPTVKVYVGGSEVLFYSFPTSETNIIEIIPYPLDDSVDIFWKGQRIQTLNIPGSYNIQIIFSGNAGSGGSCGNGRDPSIGRIENPSYKQQFGCTTEPSQQHYLQIFNEGETVNLAKLDNFVKFCLDEAPMQIITNTGSTTDKNSLVELVKGTSYTVPLGQIWGVQYIGDKSALITQCEQDQTYSWESKECLARAVLTINFPEGTEITDTSATIETQPVIYQISEILTHQTLEKSGKLLFTHIKDDEKTTPNSFEMFGDSFSSNGASYLGTSADSFTDRTNPNNWQVSFSFDGISYAMKLGEEQKLNDFVSVKIESLSAVLTSSGKVSYKIDYIFSLTIPFLETNFAESNVIVTNTYQTINGGLTLTSTDNLGNTKVENIERTLSFGENLFPIDKTNLIEIRARPYVIIDALDFKYRFDSKEAIIVEKVATDTPVVKSSTSPTPTVIQEKAEEIKEDIEEKTGLNIELIIGVIVAIGLIGLIVLYFRRK